MKRIFTFLVFSSILSFSLSAQIDLDTPLDITVSPSTCYPEGVSDCSGLVSEYFITNLDVLAADGGGFEIVGSAQNNNFTLNGELASTAGLANVAVTPVCYDLNALKALVDAMNASTSCCNGVNGITPEGVEPPICDGILQVFTSGDQVEDLDDVLAIIGFFGTTSLSVSGFQSVADQVNAAAGLLPIVCPGATAINYCVTPTDSMAFSIMTTGLNAVDSNPFEVMASPNPVNDMVTINFQSEATEQVTVKIINTLGQIVAKDAFNAATGANTMTKNMSAYDTGLYLVEVSNGTKTSIQKLIKQ